MAISILAPLVIVLAIAGFFAFSRSSNEKKDE